MFAPFVRWMKGSLGRRKTKDQPPTACIYIWEVQNVAKKRSIGICILTVDDNVSTIEHRLIP